MSESTQPINSPTATETVTGESSAGKRRWRPTRRGFLIGLGVVGGATALGLYFGVPYMRREVAGMLDGAEGPPSNLATDPWAWFAIDGDGPVKLYLPKVEMGQGIHTALAQVAAEELGVGWENLEVVQASTSHPIGADSITSGSNSVTSVFLPLRQAAATLSAMLTAEAAAVLGVAASALTLDGLTFHVTGDPAKSVTLGELAAGKTDWEAPEEPAPLKDWSAFTVIGQSLPRKDIPAKVTGAAVYGYDARLPGMKYGAVVRPPTISATLKGVQPGAAATMPGVVAVVAEQDFGGVVAETRQQAWAALSQLEADWDPGKLWQQAEIDAIVTVGNGDGITIQDEGDAGRLLNEATTYLAEYRSPFAVHAHLEAQAALVDVQPDRVRVWTPTQAAGLVRGEVAKALGLKEEQVEVQPTYLGGGFGRKTGFEAAVEAARLSRAAGVPVHVGWTRTEDMRYGYFRPPTHHILSARLDDQGNLLAIEHRQASGDVAFGSLPGIAAVILGADFGAYRGGTIRYAVPNKRTIAWRTQIPVKTGWWRGLGLLANTFAVESFMDEVAHTAGVDPLAFRLRNLDDANPSHARLKAVLQAAADKGGWGQAAPEGRARGIACCLDVDTAVAMVVEISLDRATGKIRVHNVSAAMDCGLTINPDGAIAQVEGNIMWGVGSALIEEMVIQDGVVTPANFDAYPLLTMKDAPHVDVTLLEAGDGRPRGVGEPPIGPVAAAIGNAFFALTGVRLRQLPMNEARVLAALG